MILNHHQDNWIRNHYINQNLNTNNINFFVNAITPGYIQGVLYTFEDLVLNGSLIDIKFKINDGLFLGATSNLEFISFIINNTDISDYSQDGILTIGSSGCTDLYACNYNSNAQWNDAKCTSMITTMLNFNKSP